MVRQGCVANVAYAVLDLGTEVRYGTWEELLEYVCDVKSDYEQPDFRPWWQMSKKELEAWVDVLNWIDKGYSSWYTLPENSDNAP